MVGGDDMGQGQPMDLHHRLADLLQPFFTDHILVDDAPGVAMYVVETEYRQEVGQQHHQPQQDDGQKQPPL